MPIQAVIFDFGGVLIHLRGLEGQRKWEKYLGLAKGELFMAVLGSKISDRAMVGELSEDEMWRQVAATFGLDAEQGRELRGDFWLGQQFNAELAHFMRDLRPTYKTAILSNAWSDARPTIADTFGLDKMVDTIVISAEEGVAKPDPRIYQIAAERLGVPLEESLFVDDLRVNVRAAQAVGMRGVHFKDNAQAIAEIKEYLLGA